MKNEDARPRPHNPASSKQSITRGFGSRGRGPQNISTRSKYMKSLKHRVFGIPFN